ncbi:MAG: CreA family protein [Lautropia sp.]
MSTPTPCRRIVRAAFAAGLALAIAPAARAEIVGEVDTAFRWLGKDDRIVVEAFDDPKVVGVTCFVSRARTGGVKGTIGLAEDTSDASIACRQIGAAVKIEQKLPLQEDVFTQRTSILFKKLHVVRIVDPKRNTLVYLTYSDKLIDGSPKNAVTAVAIDPSLPIPTK